MIYPTMAGRLRRSSNSCPYNRGNRYRLRCTSIPWIESRGFKVVASSAVGFKEETHAARWGLLRGCSGKATKWVDFVMADSTRRESCHLFKIEGFGGRSQEGCGWG